MSPGGKEKIFHWKTYLELKNLKMQLLPVAPNLFKVSGLFFFRNYHAGNDLLAVINRKPPLLRLRMVGKTLGRLYSSCLYLCHAMQLSFLISFNFLDWLVG